MSGYLLYGQIQECCITNCQSTQMEFHSLLLWTVTRSSYLLVGTKVLRYVGTCLSIPWFVQVCDLDNGQQLWRVNNAHSGRILALDVKPGEADYIFTTGGIDGSAHVWDRRLPTAEPTHKLSPTAKNSSWVLSCCWSPDGNSLFAARRNGSIDEWDMRSCTLRNSRSSRIGLTSGAVTAIKCTPDGKYLIA